MLTIRFEPCHPDCHRVRSTSYIIDRIVVHGMEGTFNGTRTWFKMSAKERKAQYASAAHYLISRNGEIVQMADDSVKLIHAGSKTEAGWNDRSIGIELECDKSPASQKAYPVDDYPEPMINALIALIRHLGQKHDGLDIQSRKCVVAHSEVPGQDHTDPGPKFPWNVVMAGLIWDEPKP